MHDSGPALVLVDDRRVDLSPLDDLRPLWDVRTGARTTRQRIESALATQAKAGFSGEGLVDCSKDPLPSILPEKMPVLLVNARCVLPPAALESIKIGESLVSESGIVAIAAEAERASEALESMLHGKPLGVTLECENAAFLEFPWDVIRFRDRAIKLDMQELLRDRGRYMSEHPEGVIVIGNQPLAVDLSATVHPGVVLDLQYGEIIIARGAIIRPGSVLVGPCVIGPDSTVLEQALIKPNTAIGPVCKVSGEVGGTIFQGYTNKAHHGHLGDSWIGEWVNLGAGTVNSNLLNTYGQIVAKIRTDASGVSTGMMYLGALIGDHVKTAIGTRLMTGTVLGTGCMIASTAAAPQCTDAFAWITDAGSELYRYDRFVEVARTMMSRRDESMSPAYSARLDRLYDQARGSQP
jgi:UDP-N-acetylglucosamine diphosphorylase/glucosamine-1-phosphate N-acetyltransferase